MKVLAVVRRALGISWTDLHGRRCVRVWSWRWRFELARVPRRRCACLGQTLRADLETGKGVVYAPAAGSPLVLSAVRVIGGAVILGVILGAAARIAMHRVLADVRIERSGGVR